MNSVMVRPRSVGPKGPTHGEVSEWSKVPDSKSGVAKVTGGSNPFLSAKLPVNYRATAS